MSASSLLRHSLSQPNTRLRSKQRIDLAKKKLSQLKLVFPQEMKNFDSVKLLHPGIKNVIKIVSGAHQNPKFKMNTQCFVEFENKISADRALKILDNMKVEGGHLVVHRVKPVKDVGKQSNTRIASHKGQKIHSHELTVKHLPENTRTEDIKVAFPDCSKIKIATRRRQATFTVPTIKSLESYLSRPIHTVKGEVVELISSMHPLRKSKSHPRAKNSRKRVPRLEKMESESIESDTMEVNSNYEEEMQGFEDSSVAIEEIF